MSASASRPVLRLAAGDPAGPRIEGRVEVRVAGEPLALELAVPAGPVAMEALLPVLHGFADELVSRGVAAVEREGKRVSCAAGCGACCRQIVPLAESEIRAIARLVDAMPEPRRAAVRERFADAMRRLFEHDDVVALLNRGDRPPAETAELIVRYFRLGIPCPFLEDESCSIHEVRPVICREYLVTSPAARCAELGSGTIERVPVAGRLAQALTAASKAGGETTAWIPLIAALHFVASRPEPAPARTAPEHLQAVFANLSEAWA